MNGQKIADFAKMYTGDFADLEMRVMAWLNEKYPQPSGVLWSPEPQQRATFTVRIPEKPGDFFRRVVFRGGAVDGSCQWVANCNPGDPVVAWKAVPHDRGCRMESYVYRLLDDDTAEPWKLPAGRHWAVKPFHPYTPTLVSGDVLRVQYTLTE